MDIMNVINRVLNSSKCSIWFSIFLWRELAKALHAFLVLAK